jgi:GT2 family glycosyltransferase
VSTTDNVVTPTGQAIPTEPASVVVCAYTLARWSDIVDNLAAVAEQTLPAAEVLLVVDHNDELALRARAELPGVLPGLRVIENKNKRGLSGARNTGIAAATQPLVVFLDDDAVPDRDWLRHLLRPFADSKVAGTGGRAAADWPSARPSWFPPEFDWVVGCAYVGLPVKTAPVRNVIGASMAFRADVLDRLDGFTDGIGRVGAVPLGCEETELCIRVGQLDPDYRIVYAPDSLVWHRVSANRTRFGYFARRCLAEGRSKAAIGDLIGHDAGTSSERAYATQVLPRAVLQSLRCVLRGELAALRRAAAVVAGLALTTAGYLGGRVVSRLRGTR